MRAQPNSYRRGKVDDGRPRNPPRVLNQDFKQESVAGQGVYAKKVGLYLLDLLKMDWPKRGSIQDHAYSSNIKLFL